LLSGCFNFVFVCLDSENKSNFRKRALSKEPEEEEIKKKPNCEYKPGKKKKKKKLILIFAE
jgi:hypothetical protein